MSVQQPATEKQEQSQEEKDEQANEFERNFLSFQKEPQTMGEEDEEE